MTEYRFSNTAGRKHRVHAEPEKHLGGGLSGTASRVHLEMESRLTTNTKKVRQKFVIKKFLNNDPVAAEFEFLRYKLAKNAGLKVVPTYRIDTQRGVVLMTDLTKGGMLIAEPINQDRARQIRPEAPITEIRNMAILVRDMYSDALKAARSKLLFHEDAWIFSFPREGGAVNIDFALFDFGNIEPSEIEGTSLIHSNMLKSLNTLRTFLEIKVKPGNPNLYNASLNQIRSAYNEAGEKIMKAGSRPDGKFDYDAALAALSSLDNVKNAMAKKTLENPRT